MKKIIVSQPKNGTPLDQLVSLYYIFKGNKSDQDLEFDLSKLKWTYPLLILPISAYINSSGSKISLDNCGIKSYLDIIHFPQGINSVPEIQKIIQSSKSYIPISVLRRTDKIERERLESMFASLVYKSLDTQISGIKMPFIIQLLN